MVNDAILIPLFSWGQQIVVTALLESPSNLDFYFIAAGITQVAEVDGMRPEFSKFPYLNRSFVFVVHDDLACAESILDLV